MKFKVFISSVQREFTKERKALASFIRKDIVLGKFFDVFLFEETPAANASPKNVYLKEVARSDIYLGVIGGKYGYEDAEGVSATEREYDCAVAHCLHRLVFVKQLAKREPKEAAFLAKVESECVRKSFPSLQMLRDAVTASLVRFLEERGKIQTEPFDAAVCADATMKDLSISRMKDFIRAAREKRGFKMPMSTSAKDLLTHLNLLRGGGITNAAVLLFGKKPQRFFINSEVKCAWFLGTEVEKPMADYQIYLGDVFALADQATDFVMSHISRAIGTHDGPTGAAPTRYELPRNAVLELIVNAICHRDYTSRESVQVMLFADRLEIWNAGSLPSGWTIKTLFEPHTSLPPNELLAGPMYLKGYIEKAGTGTSDVIALCRKWNIPQPEFTEGIDFRSILRRNSPSAGTTSKTLLETTLQTTLQTTSQTTLQTTSQTNGTNKTASDGISEKTSAVLEFLKVHPTASVEMAAKGMGMKKDALIYHVRILRRVFGLRHVGGTKRGRWVVGADVEGVSR